MLILINMLLIFLEFVNKVNFFYTTLHKLYLDLFYYLYYYYYYRLIIVSYMLFKLSLLRLFYCHSITRSRRKVSLRRSYVVKLKNIYVINEDSCPELYYSAKQVSDIIRSNNF